MNRLHAFALSVAALGCVLPALADMPPVFSKNPFAEARDATKGKPGILIVKFTAEWCGPCKVMDRTTWRDDKVVQWVKDHGVAIQVDVDKEPKIAQAYSVEAMPTMIAFKNGEEFDRIVGGRKAPELLAWLEDVKAGKKTADKLAERVKAAQGAGDNDVEARRDLAEQFAQTGKLDEATDQYVWLWTNMLKHEPSMVGVRSSFMASEMESLAARHKPAMDAFIKLRNDTEARVKAENNTPDDLSDWIVLNKVVNQEDQTLAWFDRVKDTPEGKQAIDRLIFRLDSLLISKGRWADYGKIIRDPKGLLQQAAMTRTMIMNSTPAGVDRTEIKNSANRMFHNSAGQIYSALLAAGRTDDAKTVANDAIQVDDTGALRLELVSAALRVEKGAKAHAEWLDAAEKAGENVAGARAELKRQTER